MRNFNLGDVKKNEKKWWGLETTRGQFMQYLTEHLVFTWVRVQKKKRPNMDFGRVISVFKKMKYSPNILYVLALHTVNESKYLLYGGWMYRWTYGFVNG